MNYQKIYNQLVEKGRLRGLIRGKGIEVHHILPKSMGGSDEDSNLVSFTYKEHFLAHILLAKIYNNKQMHYALNRLTNTGKYKTGAMYQFAREKHREVVSQFSKDMMKDRLSVKRVIDGKCVIISKEEYKQNKDLYVGLNKGRRFNNEKSKGKTIYINDKGERRHLDVNDPLVLSGEFYGINKHNTELIRKASLAGAAALKNMKWYRRPLTPKESIIHVLDVYDWFVANYNPERIKATGAARCNKLLNLNLPNKSITKMFDRFKGGYNPYDDEELVRYIDELKENQIGECGSDCIQGANECTPSPHTDNNV